MQDLALFSILGIGISLFVLLFSAILHEVAHGFVAEKLGDPTARLLGRLTLNPIPHIDPIMSIILPLLLIVTGSPIIFGGAKPVPVDEMNLRDGKKDMALVALSGPLTNVALSIIAAGLYHLLSLTGVGVGLFGVITLFFLETVVKLNILLAIFNLLPIPPLDGSKVFSLILPEPYSRIYLSIGAFGSIILIFFLLSPSFSGTFMTLNRYALGFLGF